MELLPPPPRKNLRMMVGATNTGVFFLLPDDITFNILTKLSAKVLCKLRCVSKSFSALISDPHLIQSHSSRTDPPAVLIMNTHSRVCIVDMEDFEAGNVVKETFYPDLLTKNPIFFPSRLSLSCIIDDDLKSTYILDPAAEQLTVLPDSNSNGSVRKYTSAIVGFGRVASTGEYKVVMISYSGSYISQACEVFTLGSGEWRAAQSPPFMMDFAVFADFVCSKSSILVNGEIYALPPDRVWESTEKNAIACFNLEREEWRVLQGPRLEGEREDDDDDDIIIWEEVSNIKLTELKGFVCLAHADRMVIDLWFYNNNGDEKWVREVTIDLSASFANPIMPSYRAGMHLVENNNGEKIWVKETTVHLSPGVPSPCFVCPQGIMGDGRILLQGYEQLFLYDPRGKQVTRFARSDEFINSMTFYGSSILELNNM